jgi:N-acetylmuramic acid 6-phosphate etherase
MDLKGLSNLQTASINPQSVRIDRMSTQVICTVINCEDQKVPDSLVPCLSDIAGAIDASSSQVSWGVRVIYVSAGTSGRNTLSAYEAEIVLNMR